MSEVLEHPFHQWDDHEVKRRFASAHHDIVIQEMGGAKDIIYLHALATEVTRRGYDRREVITEYGIRP